MSKKVLIVDIGNTATEFAVFEGENLQEFLGFFKIPAQIENVKKALNSYKKQGLKIDDAMIFSVVPSNNGKVQNAIKEAFDIEAKVFDWEHYELSKKNPKITDPIGADLLADIKQADVEYGGPCLVADFGTITKLIQLDEAGAFVGLSLIPGLEITMENFSSSTELLPELENTNPPKGRLGLSTAESMLHGTYWSSVYFVKEVLKTINNKETKLIITGGNLRLIKEEFPDAIIDKELTLKGMSVLYKETVK